jgi:shikimate dehydrogenase
MSPRIRGTTRVAAVIGSPVRHSLSPVLHNAAFAAVSLDWVFVTFEVAPGGGAAALTAARTLGLAGLSVTMPHKTDAAAACDTRSADAEALRSVNCVTRRADGTLHGESTDGPGFCRALAEAGVEAGGASVLLLGAGGAARAVTLALGRAGARIVVAARRDDAAAATAALAPGAATVPWHDRNDALAAAELVVQATAAGMGGTGESPLDPAALRPQHVVADLVYDPPETPLLAAARAAGATGIDGVGMLVHQAALAFEHWTGRPAPVAVMAAAARAALAGGGPSGPGLSA